ncbi:RNA polymerase sigma factor [Alteromonas lipolytica]|uniref:RNA polymerase subunit sigma-70 n=1 Tax=Alteromonas lipolytica TaxID=1856405 RepID=A0A1E8FB12_9ALTE|nr:RNA polymerase sigma factor [Alteromonas lipolytica]OFI32966.1 RNA polymerase subunit sigma-70 [Alteromonas lipolytica]GGF63843.1 DNA-directed RNA polymerase sigma-70 factor [Alteromonas lipolytica]
MQKDFRQILSEHQALLSRVASSYEANESLRQELLQEIALAVWQGLERFNGDASLKTYILRIAHNRAVTHVSKEVKSRDVSLQDDDNIVATAGTIDDEPEYVASRSRQVSTLLEAIRTLPVTMRQVMTLTLEGLSYQEIADVCGLNKNHVGVLLQRAKTTLQERMSND